MRLASGHCGLGAPLAIARRAGRGSRALRTDLNTAGGIDPGDAAAAIADFDDIHHRQHHRMTCNVSADIIATCDFRVKVFDETCFGRRSTHIEGDDMMAAE